MMRNILPLVPDGTDKQRIGFNFNNFIAASSLPPNQALPPDLNVMDLGLFAWIQSLLASESTRRDFDSQNVRENNGAEPEQ